jgi:Ca2+-binding RTX toxin-like protein
MSTVTVTGAHGPVVLSFDTEANAILARKIAAAISAGVQNGFITPADDTDGPPPPLAPGATGEFVQTMDGLTSLPAGYKAFIDTASESVVFGSGDADESVLSSIGDMTFFATGGSGTVVAGGGNNRIIIPGDDSGNWSINTGKGDDAIFAMGDGNDTINPGGGNNAISLGGGKNVMQSTGDDTVIVGSGSETIAAIGAATDLIFGGASQLFYVGTKGSVTVFGGSGSDTFFGGSGPDVVHGGTEGSNFLVAGIGGATLFGGGNGDLLVAMGAVGQALHAGAGNETLNGALAPGADTLFGGSGAVSILGGANDTFVAGTGSATVDAPLGGNAFVFNNGKAGGSALIQGFISGQDTIDLLGYGKNEVTQALNHQQAVAGNATITLSDHTTITFVGVSKLSAADFSTIPGAGAGNGNGNDHGQGNQGHGSNDGDDLSHIRDMPIGHSDH